MRNHVPWDVRVDGVRPPGTQPSNVVQGCPGQGPMLCPSTSKAMEGYVGGREMSSPKQGEADDVKEVRGSQRKTRGEHESRVGRGQGHARDIRVPRPHRARGARRLL